MSNYRFALRAYPSAYRQEHGAEVVDIANELEGNRWAFKQSRSLVVGGLRARAREATNGSRRSVWSFGARVGLVTWLVMGASSRLVYTVDSGLEPMYGMSPLLVGVLLLPIAAMTISTRWWVAALITAAHGWGLLASFTDPNVPTWFAASRVPLTAAVVGLAWWLALATDGRRAASPVAAGLLMGAATALNGMYSGDTTSFSFSLVTPVILILGGLMVSRIDPRVTTTGAVFAALLVVSILPFVLFNGATGWAYWAPIGTSILVVAIMVAASWSGVRRLAAA